MKPYVFARSLPCLAIAVAICSGSASAQSASHTPVVISVSTNTGEISGFNNIAIRRHLSQGQSESIFSGNSFAFQSVTPGVGRDTALFIGLLPPGEYSFGAFSAGTKRLNVGEQNLLGKFTVTSGKPVDLGRLVLTPVNHQVMIGRIARPSSNLDLIRRIVPAKLDQFAGELASGWVGQVEATNNLEKYSLANTVGADCATERADGTVFAASRLGTVLTRSSLGKWRGLRGAGLESLLCLLPVELPDAELVAVGEMLALVRKPRGSDQLVPVDPGNLPPGDLIKINGSPGAGWFVVHKVGNKLTLYRSSKLDAGDWKVVLQADARENAQRNYESMFSWQTEAGMGYAGPTGPIKIFDNASGQWSERALPPSQSRLLHAAVATNGDLVIHAANTSSMWDHVNSSFVSKDMGANWKAILPPPATARRPMQIFHDGTLMTLNNAAHYTMSQDKGATWTVGGKAERLVLPLRTGTLLDFDDGKHGLFSIRSSVDGGKQWDTEYSTFNRQAYDAEKK